MSDERITITVLGTPRPQGSMRLHKRGDKTVARYAENVYEWRGRVTDEVRKQYDGPLLEGPVRVTMTFDLPRPKSHFGTGRNAGKLKLSAPELWHAQMPDIDKLERAINDAVTDAGNVWGDDGQVASVVKAKRWATDGDVPGVEIVVEALT